MGARTRTALCGWLALCAVALSGCGGGSDATVTPAPVVSAAEAALGTELAPPDSVIAVASVLGADELPPDATALATDDLPPNS